MKNIRRPTPLLLALLMAAPSLAQADYVMRAPLGPNSTGTVVVAPPEAPAETPPSAPTLGAFTVPELTVGDGPYTLIPPTSNSGGAWSYTSSDANVATISGGVLTIVGSGSAVITASQAALDSYAVGSTSATLTVAPAPVAAAYSCKDLLLATPGLPSGWYSFDPDGPGPAVSMSYYCDMVSDGGGWTRIVRQTESQPVTNWNGGVNGDSYALSTVQIPGHSWIGIGRDEQATYIDYVAGSYHGGDLYPPVRLTSPKTGLAYDMLRVYTGTAAFGNPEEGVYTSLGDNTWGDGDWRNALTFDRVGGRLFTWLFNPQQQTPARRGGSMAGAILTNSEEPYAWTVWVK